MSDKRPGNGFQYVQPRRKIPKLDVSIVAGASQQQPAMPRFVQPVGRAVQNGHRSSVGPSRTSIPAAPVVPQADSEDMWGDDEDFIMLASQVAENVENECQNILVGSMDLSFAAFERNGNPASCSTQKPDDDDVLRQFRTSDAAEDDVFTEFIDYDQVDHIDKHIDEYLRNEQNTLVRGYGTAASSAGTSSDIETKQKQLEQKSKVLCDQLEQAQRENSRLQSEVFKMNEKCQTKDGEIAMVRYDLQLNRNAQNVLRKDKLNECERIKNEYSTKLNELERQNQRQQSELEFKSLEIINMKSKLHDMSLNRSQSTRHTTSVVHTKPKLPESTVASMFRLFMADAPPPKRAPSHQLFSQSRPINRKQSLINSHTDHLRSNVTQLQLLVAEQHTFLAAHQAPSDSLLERVFEVASSSIWTIRNECRIYDTCRSSHTKNMFYQYATDELQQRRSQLLSAESVYMDGEMFTGEMLCAGRRVLGCLASVCRASRTFCEWLVGREFREESHTCLRLLSETFSAIGCSSQWQCYFGLLEAASMVLEAIAENYTGTDDKFDPPIQHVLQSLIFCRPNTRTLLHLSVCLHTISAHYAHSDFLQTICRRRDDYVIIKESMKQVQFSAKSCPLQMYSVLLQTEFVPFQTLTPGQLDVLVPLTLNSLRLLQHCAEKPVSWMFRVASGSKKESCLCYAQLVCACIVLVHQCLRHWVDNPRIIDLRSISTIAQLGVIMISDHFVMHYESIVLRVGGPWVKQRLHVAFAWISQHSRLFQFERSHLQAIQSISSLRRIPQMIELLGAGESGGQAAGTSKDTDAANKVWSDHFRSVAPTVVVSKGIDYEFNDFDADATQMDATQMDAT